MISQLSTFDIDSRGLLTLHGQVWMPYAGGVRRVLIEEDHKLRFSVHLGATKMYIDLKHSYWWPCMKRDATWFVE